MKLYTYFRSSAAYRLRIALNLKGVAYESIGVSLPAGAHREAAFEAVNPQRLVPAIADGDRVLVQSMATIEYLDETHPNEPRLIPDDAAARAYVRAVAQTIGCDIHPLNNLRVLKYLEDVLGQDEAARRAWYAHWIAEGFAGLEGLLARSGRAGRFCCGDRVTMADVCLVPQVANAMRFDCPLDDYPLIRAIDENCAALEPFAAAHPNRQPDGPGG